MAFSPLPRCDSWTGLVMPVMVSRCPYNYWPRKQWQESFKRLRLKVDMWNGNLRLYPPWIDWVFGRSLHFLSVLTRPAKCLSDAQ